MKHAGRVLACLLGLGLGTAHATAEGPGLSVAAGGDVTPGTRWMAHDYPQPQRMADMTGALAQAMSGTDVRVFNLEGAVSDTARSGKSGCQRCYTFISPTATAQAMMDILQPHAVSLANNHGRDGGVLGLSHTQQLLDQNGIVWAGTVEQPWVLFPHAQGAVAWVAMAPHQGMADPRNLALVDELVTAARHQARWVIVSFHMGAEGRKQARVTGQAEHFLGENRGNIQAAAYRAIDAGADLVLGHGPHVPRALELYQGHLIAYSLGNLWTYGPFLLEGELGWSPVLRAQLNPDGTLLEGRIISGLVSPRSAWREDPEQRAARRIQTLTHDQFSGQLVWDNQGGFRPVTRSPPANTSPENTRSEIRSP